jgi:hypothetical protein
MLMRRIAMTRPIQFAQIFTVFGNYLLDGDYVRNNDTRSAYEARSRARKAALTEACWATVRL